MKRHKKQLLRKQLLRGAFFASLTIFHSQLALAQEEKAEQANELPTIRVSANPLSPSLLEYGKPISVLDKEDLESNLESTLGEALRLEPGVRSSFFGQGASRPVIRGFGGDRVKVLKNGVSTGDVSDLSEDHVVVADPLQAQQIEILRGPETLLYGSGAIGGAVNVIDDSIPETSLGKPIEGEILGQYGDSADNERTIAGRIRGEYENFNLHVSGFYRQTEDFEIPGFAESDQLREIEAQEQGGQEDDEEESQGLAENTDTETWGATVGGSYVWDKGFIGVSVSGFESDYGVPGHLEVEEEGAEEEEEGEEAVRIEAEQLRVDLRGRIDDVSEYIESVKFKLGLTDYEHDEIEGGGIASTFERENVDLRLDLLHSSVAGLKGAVGFQFFYDDFSAVGEEAFLTPTKTISPALFFFEEAEITDSLKLRFGGRVEAVSHDPNSLETQNFVPFSVSAGPIWDIKGDGRYNLGLTFAYTERAPNAVELFADGAHLARQIFEVGNEDLDKEASFGVDLVLSKSSGVLTGAFTPFYQNFTNYINLGSTREVGEGLPIFNYEDIDAYFWGFEFEAALNLNELVDLGAHTASIEHQLDFVRARNEDAGDDLPRIPPLRNIVRANYAYKDLFSAAVEGVFVEDQDDIAENEIPTDSYALLNAEANLKLSFLNREDLKFFVKATNLTDNEARVHSSFLKDQVPLRGRAFTAGIRGRF